MNPASAILMSIKPAFSSAILTGEKTIELRRRPPAVEPGTLVLIYSSSPDQHLCGVFETGKILKATPGRLWRRVRRHAAIDKAAYDAYFADCEIAYGIEIVNPRAIPPTALPVRPPQSWQWLRPADSAHSALLSLATA